MAKAEQKRIAKSLRQSIEGRIIYIDKHGFIELDVKKVEVR